MVMMERGYTGEITMTGKAPKVKSLYKALKLLDLFNKEHPELGVMELAKLSGMQKSSAYNIIDTFQMCGFISKNPSTGKYRLWHKLLELSNVMQSHDNVSLVIKPFLDRLSDECHETVYCATPSGTDAVYIESALPNDRTFTRYIVGVKVKMYCTAVGKAMLAFLGEDLLQKVVAEGMQPNTPYTLTNEQALRADLETTRRRGYSIDNMENEYGIRCVGVPVWSASDTVVGALSVSGPSLRVMDEKVAFFAEKLLETSRAIRPLIK